MSESASGEASSDSTASDNSSSVCPTCGGEYKSNLGMRTHHAKTHGESLSYRDYSCEYCETEFQDLRCKDDVRFCSQDCLHKWRSENERGENHPNYCQVEVECFICGKSQTRKPSHLENQKNVFCSYDCHREWQSQTQVGENHHHYNGGRAKEYGPNWHRQRRKAIKRDRATCQRCGSKDSELSRSIHVHHITKRREYMQDGELDHEQANRLENLVCLCGSCHKSVEQWGLNIQIKH